jgi:CRISPR/Cas system CMR subunit Cmr6 (Cas7 group RAMP superfamily)
MKRNDVVDSLPIFTRLFRLKSLSNHRKYAFSLYCGHKKPQNKAVECLKNTLEQHGIGAKTAVGYGVWVRTGD